MVSEVEEVMTETHSSVNTDLPHHPRILHPHTHSHTHCDMSSFLCFHSLLKATVLTSSEGILTVLMLHWAHSTESQLGWGLDSWTAPKESFCNRFTSEFRVIVLLHDLSSLWHYPVGYLDKMGIHFLSQDGKLSRPWDSRATQNHDAPTTVLHLLILQK